MPKNAKPINILIVDDSFEDREILKRYIKGLKDMLCETREAKNVDEAMAAILEKEPDILFIDFRMPGATGLELLEKLQDKTRFNFPVIMLTGEGNETIAVKAMKNGVMDYLVKDDLRPESVRVAMISAIDRFMMDKTIEQQRRQLEIAARTDGLTALWNRRYFDEQIELEFERAQRYGLVLSLAMADIDHFKMVNDTHGHLIGDAVLMGFADIFRQGLRMSDFAARFGGEEFCVIMPSISLTEAATPICRLAYNLRNRKFRNDHGEEFSVSASFGVVEVGERHKSFQDVIDDADQALYAAKEKGRDRVILYQPDGSFLTVCSKENEMPT